MNCAFDSNVFIQESRKGWPERGWNGERTLVILSAAKDLSMGNEILRGVYTERSECARDDTGWPIRLSSPDALMVQ
jgi:hypothetical protein